MRWLLILAALFCGACSDDGTGPRLSLEITSMSPAPDAANVETGASIAVVFNRDIDPATLTPTTFLVKRSSVALPAAVSYDPATRTARATVPLVPNLLYEVEVTTGVRTPLDSGLSAPQRWSFTTRAWQTVAVDAPGIVGGYTSLAVDGSGRLHVSYQDDTNGDLKYAICAAACSAAGSWQSVTVDASGIVGLYTSLAVGGSGRLHISYQDGTNSDLKYATCAAGCNLAASWQTVTVDAAGIVGSYTSLAVEGSGRVHVSYFDNTNLNLKYVTCATGCNAAASWQVVTVDAAGNVGAATSLAVEGSGRLHVSYFDGTNGDLKYAACAADCHMAASWQAATIDAGGAVGSYTSLAADGNGRLHIGYHDFTNNDLKYASCAASCHVAASWQAVTVDAPGNVGQYPSLDVDGRGRLHISYVDFANGDLKYATCAASCPAAASWRVVTVDAPGNMGLDNSLAVDGSGRVHVSYYDGTNGDLKCIE